MYMPPFFSHQMITLKKQLAQIESEPFFSPVPLLVLFVVVPICLFLR